MDTKVFDGVFWTFTITSIIGFLLALTKMLYKSKCKSFKCLGCELIRDTEGEEKFDELELEQHKTFGSDFDKDDLMGRLSKNKEEKKSIEPTLLV